MVKLKFPTPCDAQHGAYYLQDRGYSVTLVDNFLTAERLDMADLILVVTTYRARIAETTGGDEIKREWLAMIGE